MIASVGIGVFDECVRENVDTDYVMELQYVE